MTISRHTFDPTKSYKRVRFHEDRDLLDSELNELQDIERYDRQLLWDRIFTPGSILQGMAGTINGAEVSFTPGSVYLDGQPVSVPGATLTFPEPGVHTIYVDVFRREVTAADDPELVNPLTGEPTAEREKWIASLQTRDTSGDPLPDGSTGRTVAPLYTFDREAATLTPVVEHVVTPNDPGTLSGHIGQGGLDQHPAATAELAGFMTQADRTKLDAIAPNATRGQRSVTLVVAAADSSAAGKAAADYVCPGVYTLTPPTGDQDTINAALAVAAALPRGGMVILLEGNYWLTGSLLLPSRVSLSGQGSATRLQAPDGATDAQAFAMIRNADQAAGNADLRISDLLLDGRNAGNGGMASPGIDWWAPVRGRIERVHIQNCAGHGLTLRGDSGHPIWYVTIRGCTVDACRGIGIWMNGNGWMNRLLDSMIQRNEGEAGLRLSALSDSIVTQNCVYYNMQHGVLLDSGCGHITVAQNIISHNGIGADDTYTNLRIALADRCLLQGNQCRQFVVGADLDQPKYGIHIAAGLNNGVIGNYLFQAAKTDDLLDGGTNSFLHANVTSAGLEAP